MKTTHIFIILLMVFSACTRENYLDFEPKGKVIPTKIADYRGMLDQVAPDPNINNVRGFSGHHDFNILASDNYFLNSETRSAFGISPEEINMYLYRESISTDNGDDNTWITYYNQIYVANVVIDGLETVADGTLEEIEELRAEAYLHRAYAYFNLVNIYSVHYNPESASTDLGVPIREGIDLEGVDFTRASVQGVYDLILNDLINNMDALPDVQSIEECFRPSKAGAYTLLARVYLYQGNYAKALEAVEGGLSLKSNLRDINSDPIDPRDEEVIAFPRVLNDEQIIWFKDSDGYSVVSTNEFYDLYEDNDMRKRWFANPRTYFFIEIDNPVFVAQRANSNSNASFTTSDLYLMLAECNARLGNIQEATDALNALRIKRYETGTYTSLAFDDATTLLSFIKDEIRREQASSVLRTFDIKRYNRLDGDEISITHTLDGETVTIEPNSLNWAFPIAQRYIDSNPEIKQNPRQ